MKIKMALICALASANALFCGFYAPKVPCGVRVDGIDVGGLSYNRAAVLVRAETEENLRKKTLTVVGKSRDYVFSYPEIGYKDGLSRILRTAKKGGNYSSEVSYYLKGGGEILKYIAEAESVAAREPSFSFRAEGEPFIYDFGRDGERVDVSALARDVKRALSTGDKVRVSSVAVPRRLSADDILNKTQKLCSFTTYFDGENLNRAANIRLAANLINGVCVKGGEVFSFNDAVGERTSARGFFTAKIIEDGEFVEGVGGGVCQASTTLYNAALLAGCKIVEYHPHSLPVSYVPPSRDAMVSGKFCDLKFSRKTDFFIRADVTDSSVTFTFYGEPDGFSYSLESAVTGYIDPPKVWGEQPRSGRSGIKSECYLISSRNGYSAKKLLRRDSYLPQAEIIAGDGDVNQSEIHNM